MSNFDAKEYNEITYQLSQALLWKVTDALLSVSVESKDRKLNLRAYLDSDKTSGLEEKLMADFENDARERLSGYEIEVVVSKVRLNDEFLGAIRSTGYLRDDSFRSDIFLRFNRQWL